MRTLYIKKQITVSSQKICYRYFWVVVFQKKKILVGSVNIVQFEVRTVACIYEELIKCVKSNTINFRETKNLVNYIYSLGSNKKRKVIISLSKSVQLFLIIFILAVYLYLRGVPPMVVTWKILHPWDRTIGWFVIILINYALVELLISFISEFTIV